MEHKHRTDVRRAQNKLQKSFDLEFKLVNGSNLDRGMEEFFCLYETRWGAMEPAIRAFHNEAATKFLAKSLLRLTLLRIDRVPAAAIYAFTTGETLYCYLSGFNPALGKLSPGAVLLRWTIEGAIAEGLTEVDFLRQPEAYKYLWGAKDRVNYKIT